MFRDPRVLQLKRLLGSPLLFTLTLARQQLQLMGLPICTFVTVNVVKRLYGSCYSCSHRIVQPLVLKAAPSICARLSGTNCVCMYFSRLLLSTRSITCSCYNSWSLGRRSQTDYCPSISSGPGSFVKQHEGTRLLGDADGEELRIDFGNPELLETVCPLISLGCHGIHRVAGTKSAQLRCSVS